ncbi:hypothetical protein GJ744_012174, partial [Endocarpon pusillum]
MRLLLHIENRIRMAETAFSRLRVDICGTESRQLMMATGTNNQLITPDGGHVELHAGLRRQMKKSIRKVVGVWSMKDGNVAWMYGSQSPPDTLGRGKNADWKDGRLFSHFQLVENFKILTKMGFVKLSTPFILAASLLSSVAQAAPALHAIKARDYVTEIVTETVWTTVDITTTLYADELPSTSAPATASAEVTSTEKIESTPKPTSLSAAAPAPTSSEKGPVAASSATEESADSSTSQTPEFTAPGPSVPAESPPASVPAVSATPEEPTPVVVPTPEIPAPSAPSAPATYEAPTPSPVSAVAKDGSCEKGSPCTGDVTHWDGGLGACGTNVDTESDMAIALPYGFMGPLSNSNPYCGRSVTIKTTSGSTVKATVKDKCMGCEGRSIDCTNKAFNAITDGKGDGRVKNIEWTPTTKRKHNTEMKEEVPIYDKKIRILLPCYDSLRPAELVASCSLIYSR